MRAAWMRRSRGVCPPRPSLMEKCTGGPLMGALDPVSWSPLGRGCFLSMRAGEVRPDKKIFDFAADLPLNLHPAAIRVSGGFAPCCGEIGGVVGRCEIAKRGMWTLLVVIGDPTRD